MILFTYMERYSAYDNFAWLYNLEWAAYSENIFPLLKKIAGENLPDGAEILDLCCGTGQLAKALSEKGYSVTGIDGSKEMLRYAKVNAPDAEFIVDDARTFQLPSVYNAVFSTFDSLNHIMSMEELRQVFKNVNGCLLDGGIFIFDLNTKRAFETQWKGHKDVKEKLDYFYVVREDYNPEKRIAQFICTIFRRRGKDWKRSDIILHERYYSEASVISSLKKAGFTDIRTYSFDRERGLQKPAKNSHRIFYYARKA